MNYSTSQLYQAIIKQLTRMLARSLDKAPAADELPMYAQVLTDDLMNCGYMDGDAAKVGGAIDRYGRSAERWPRTGDIQAVLREMRDEETRAEMLSHSLVSSGPRQSILKPSVPGKLLDRDKVKKLPPKSEYILNDVQHEALIKENSLAGEIYRDRMGYPKPEHDEQELLSQFPKSESLFEDMHDNINFPARP